MCGAPHRELRPNFHRCLQIGRSRWNWYLFEIHRNIQVHDLAASFSGSVSNSGCGENYCGKKCSQAKNHNTFREPSVHQSVLINSRTVYDCRRCLNEMVKQYEVCITWVPGHRDISGNCRANDLARRGTTITLFNESYTLGMLLSTCRLIIDNAIVDLVNSRCAASDKGRTVRNIWPRLVWDTL